MLHKIGIYSFHNYCFLLQENLLNPRLYAFIVVLFTLFCHVRVIWGLQPFWRRATAVTVDWLVGRVCENHSK